MNNLKLNNTERILTRLELLKFLNSEPTALGDARESLMNLCITQIEGLLRGELELVTITSDDLHVVTDTRFIKTDNDKEKNGFKIVKDE